jgi:hypothetical protein
MMVEATTYRGTIVGRPVVQPATLKSMAVSQNHYLCHHFSQKALKILTIHKRQIILKMTLGPLL